jgi:hypothetical protein
LFQEALPSQPLLTWLTKRPGFKGVHSFSTRPSSPLQGLLAVPTPVNREADIATAHQLRSKFKHVAVVLPEAAYADNRWAFLKRHFRRLETLPVSLPIYTPSQPRALTPFRPPPSHFPPYHPGNGMSGFPASRVRPPSCSGPLWPASRPPYFPLPHYRTRLS